eukprot:5465945-Prymnesium_polylepis.1
MERSRVTALRGHPLLGPTAVGRSVVAERAEGRVEEIGPDACPGPSRVFSPTPNLTDRATARVCISPRTPVRRDTRRGDAPNLHAK